MVVIIILNFLFLLLSIIFTIRTKDILFVISSILFFMGTFFMVMGAMEDYKNDSIKKYNINPAIIEYIVDVRKQNDETSITTDNAIAVYLECKRNGFNEEETISFLLPDITKEEAKSIVKTYNLLEKEKEN